MHEQSKLESVGFINIQCIHIVCVTNTNLLVHVW